MSQPLLRDRGLDRRDFPFPGLGEATEGWHRGDLCSLVSPALLRVMSTVAGGDSAPGCDIPCCGIGWGPHAQSMSPHHCWPHGQSGPQATVVPSSCTEVGRGWGGSETPWEHPRKRWEHLWCPSCSRAALHGDQTNPSLPTPLFTPLSRTSQHLAHLEVARCCCSRDLSLQAAAAPP